MNATTGMISGGWEFVIAAYTLTAIVIGSYVVSVLSRFSKERAAARRRDSEPEVN
jgi:hypothetical protein